MNALARATVVVPARDEAETIAAVVRDLREARAGRVIVVDNGSRDGTGGQARDAGAKVIRAARAGYGWACLAGSTAAADSELVGFMDGDGSFVAGDLAALAEAVARGDADLAIGVRRDAVALHGHQRLGNTITLALLHALYGLALPDIGPLRVVRRDLLDDLDMRGSRYGWLIEMLAKSARRGARVVAVPVSYGPRRGGRSKVSGSALGSILAGTDFLAALVRSWRS